MYLDAAGRDCEEVLELAYLNSYHQTGLKSLPVVAVLAHGDLRDSLKVDPIFLKIDNIPFDCLRRRFSVVVESNLTTMS